MGMIHTVSIILLISLINHAISSEISNAKLKGSSVDDDDCDYTYEEGEPTGPSNWGALHPEWNLCKDGLEQTPINIVVDQAKPLLSRLSFNYTTTVVELEKECHNIALAWPLETNDFIEWENERYVVQNLHWHYPSEHVINGRRYDLEGHIVHRGVLTNKYLVIGILYLIGSEDAFLSEIIDTFPSLQVVGNARTGEKGTILLNDIDFGDNYYHYNGSLTTPPCTENISWIVLAKEHTASQEQIRNVVNVEGINSRPLQPLNGRQVYKFTSNMNDLTSFS